MRAILDHAYEASQGLQIIAPEKALAESGPVPDHVQKARKAIAEAECVYILGYGFDQMNSALLELPEYLKMDRGSKAIMFTNYNNSGVVNKNAARLFALPPNELLTEGGRIIPNRNSLCEKSVRDVYGALVLDFDSPRNGLAGEPTRRCGRVRGRAPGAPRRAKFRSASPADPNGGRAGSPQRRKFCPTLRYAASLCRAAPFSAIMIVGALVLVENYCNVIYIPPLNLQPD